MNVCKAACIALGLAVAGPALPAHDAKVIGYYVGYQNALQAPAQVDYSAMTHVAVGSALPRADGTFDTQFYLGVVAGPAWARDVVARAHAAGIQAILHVGGAGDDTVAAFRASYDEEVRADFVANLAAIVADYGFDGIDLNWEPISAADQPNLLALAQGLRAALPGRFMSIPLGNANMNYGPPDPFFGALSESFDLVNMMSYGMLWTGLGSGWASWHHAPLFGQAPSHPMSVSYNVEWFLNSGIPRGKIGVGMGFYGEPYENGTWSGGVFVHRASPPFVTAPRQEISQAANQAEVRLSDNWFSYSNIMRYVHEPAAWRWDDEAQASYLSFAVPKELPWPSWAVPPVRTSYVVYEDEASIAAKGAYVHEQELGGAIVWTVSQGYLEWAASGEKDPLMKAVKLAFLSRPTLRCLSPNGGEHWTVGSGKTLSWSVANYTGTLRLVLFKAGTRFGNIATGVDSSLGSYAWIVGSTLDGGTASEGSDYRLYIRDSANTFFAASDCRFALINPAPLQVTSPNGGESWPIGSPQNITWTAGGTSGAVRIILFNKAAKIGQIVANVPASQGTYAWIAGSHSGGMAAAGIHYAIRIQAGDGSQDDFSDGPFILAD